MIVTISVTDTEVFKQVLEILKYAYEKSSEETKTEIHIMLSEAIGRTHDLSDFGHLIKTK
jgi:hypothetical protein